MSILDQINIAIQDQTGNNHPPQRVTITKTYQNNPNLCDITTKNGNKLTKIPVQGTPQINTEAILIYEDGDQNKPIIIPNTDTYTRDNIDNLLKNKITEPNTEGRNGQALVTDGRGGRSWKTIEGGGGGDGGIVMVGSFTINNEGHLIATIPNGADNPYYINANGHLIYDTVNSHNEGEIT